MSVDMVAKSFGLPINKLELDYVKDQIRQCSGTQFDPEVANVFLNILENKYEKIEEIMEKYPS